MNNTVRLCIVFIVTVFAYNPSLAENKNSLLEYERRVDVERDRVAFVEITSEIPVNIFIMYTPQYTNYMKNGSTQGAFEVKDVLWYFYPIPAMFDNQTVFFIVKEGAKFSITYENVKERIERLFKGGVLLRSGANSFFRKGIDSIRLTQNLPGLQIEIEASEDVEVMAVKVMDYISLTRGIKSFEDIYRMAGFKGRRSLSFRSPDFDDLYVIVKSKNGVNIRYKTWANKEAAIAGC